MFPEPTSTPAVAAGPIAQPAVRRGGQWTLTAYQAIDLDSMDSWWNATSDTWTTQDVAY